MKNSWLVLFLLIPLVATAQIEGAIDLHVHSAPDSTPRSLTAIETAELAQRHGMRAVLFKNHYVETATLAYLVSQVVPGIESYGGIALNRSVGGINPAAVEQMAAMTGGHGRVVWMPTADAAQGPFATGIEEGNIVHVSRNGELLPEVVRVLELIAELDLALATGHSSPQDSLLLVRAANELGIERIVITHPLNALTMPAEMQREVIGLGALLEFPISMASPIGSISFEDFSAQIRAIGPENIVLSTDLGQAANPVAAAGFSIGVTRLLEAGFSQNDLDIMIKRNPAHILNLAP